MKFSIITVAYNAAGTIADTLTSIVSQKGVEIESIVIDGASADNTMGIVSSFGDRISCAISEPDHGIYDAMSKGLARATGDVVAFLNADDYYVDSNVLRDVASVFESTAAPAVGGTVKQIDGAGRSVRVIRSSSYHPSKLKWGVAPPHPALFVKTHLARNSGGFDIGYKYAGDFELFVKMSRSADFRLATIDRTLAAMRMGGLSTSGKLIYFLMSPELKRALDSNGARRGSWLVYLRAFRKFREVLAAMKITKSAKS